MGALHAGHARLIEEARTSCDRVVVTIFVNPLQFDRPDDLQRYPRTMDADVALCGQLGVDVVFAPQPPEMYPEPPMLTIDVGRIAEHLCGRHRPGHFRGVATVVMKLFQIVQADVAFFGEKDAQQLAVIRRLVADFNVPIEIVGVPTVREADGLALSSRNRRIDPADRPAALTLYRSLQRACREIRAGTASPDEVKRTAAAEVSPDPAVKLEYLEVVDPADMQPVDRIAAPVLVAGALWVREVRLIDNLRCAPPGL
jgi:pantoate--beta-alanine ligase